MKNIQTVTGVLAYALRFDTSKNGNPRYKVRVGRYEFFTGIDSSYGYSITNYVDELVTVKIGEHYGKTTLKHIEKL